MNKNPLSKVPRLIGLTGTNGSGKGAAARYFKKKGYDYYSLSDLIREELWKKNEPVTRNNLIRMGNDLRRTHGADILARRVLERIKGKAVIDSIRNPSEVECLREQTGFILLAVDAPVEVRFERAQKRGRDESASTLEEFRKKEAEEMTEQEKGQQLQTCMKLADFLIINDGTIDQFNKKLEKIL